MSIVKLIVVLCFTSVCTITTADEHSALSDVSSDHVALEGFWKAEPHNDRPGFIGLRFEGNKCFIYHADLPIPASAIIRLDSKKDPKHLDMWLSPTAGNPRPPVSEGIYRIEGDVLIISSAGKCKQRPGDFDAGDIWKLRRADHDRK